ncbi:integrase arm-type DNA-binding domain-containing protein [Otariodibacter sp.]|uniref:tyrosine-type recombinase/integrase n=1 Tax=Otariodibacter sp. TaxID=3030919 RepID=UPI002635B7C6|nr:integrase arm-type DNA-binding domain-containing protein [Otariodibacter sp.]
MTTLTDTKIKQAKPKEKDYILSDGGGLRLIVKKNGTKTWVLNYYKPYIKKKSNITIGTYPVISLAMAREKRGEFKVLLAQDIDPIEHREQLEREKADRLNRTFEKMAWTWFEARKLQANFSERTAKDTMALMNRHIIPLLGKYPIDKITPLIAINALKPLEEQGKLETVKKILSKINDVMRFALHRGFIASNNLAQIHKEFDKPVSKGMNTIDPEEIDEFLTLLYQARDNNRFSLNIFYAVLLVMLTGSRPSEVAKAKWEDINFQERTWTYRVQKGNKNLPEGREHIVTLSTQAIEVLEKVKVYNAIVPMASNSPFVFVSLTAKSGHITIEAIRQAIIKSLGVGRLTTHGIRHLFSTTLNETGAYSADWIESALSHKDKDRMRKTYNKAQYLEHRFYMLQEWGDYIEENAPKPFL